MDQATQIKLLMFVMGLLVTWNAYLFKRTLENERRQSRHELDVAKNYTSKEDLKEMLNSMETRLEKQLSNFIKTIKG